MIHPYYTTDLPYQDVLNDFKDWTAKSHAKNWLIFPQNVGPCLSIDETELSKGELYNNPQKVQRKKVVM